MSQENRSVVEKYINNTILPFSVSTSVKLDESDKQKLERLQAAITLKKGKKMTQQELLSRLIDTALENEDIILEKLFRTDVPISDEEFKKIISLSEDWGIKTKWEEIDRVLYGKRQARR